MVATELREGDGRLPGGREVDKPAVMKQTQSLGREGKPGSLGRPYSDCRLAIELLHSAAAQLPGSREASTAPGSGLQLRAAAREDPTRAPSCTACRPRSPTLQGRLLSATATPLRHSTRVLPSRPRQHVRETGARGSRSSKEPSRQIRRRRGQPHAGRGESPWRRRERWRGSCACAGWGGHSGWRGGGGRARASVPPVPTVAFLAASESAAQCCLGRFCERCQRQGIPGLSGLRTEAVAANSHPKTLKQHADKSDAARQL